jgi:hypothetical protein
MTSTRGPLAATSSSSLRWRGRENERMRDQGISGQSTDGEGEAYWSRSRQIPSLRSGQTGTPCPRCQVQRRRRPGSECSVHAGRTRPRSSEFHSGPPLPLLRCAPPNKCTSTPHTHQIRQTAGGTSRCLADRPLGPLRRRVSLPREAAPSARTLRHPCWPPHGKE